MAKKTLEFEELMEKLEKIANELENENLTLDESVSKFEEGIKLSKQCKKILDDSEKKITILLNDGTEEDFNVDKG